MEFISKDDVRGKVIIDMRYAKNKLIKGKEVFVYPVKYRITHASKQVYLKANVDLSKEDWEKLSSTKAKGLLEIKKDLEKGLDKIKEHVDAICDKGFYDNDKLLHALKRGRKDDVFLAFKYKIDILEKKGKINTMQSYKSTVGSIWVFVNGYEGKDKFYSLYKTDAWLDERFKRLTINQVTENFVREYKEYLKHKGKSTATVGVYLRALRAILNECEMHRSSYPFGKEKQVIPKGRRRRNALTKENIVTFIDFPLTGNRKLYRDLWLFTYLGYGMNLKDVFRLKKNDIKGSIIEFVRAKTDKDTEERPEIRIFMHPHLQRIINEYGCNGESEYLFPFLYSGITPADEAKIISDYSSRIRKEMKKLAKQLNLDVNPTLNAIRHSFATIAEEAGIRQTMIKVCMGHSLADVTEGYQGTVTDRELEILSSKLL